MSPIRAIRSLGNSFGLAWWARVETNEPDVTYWFGPFLTRRSLKEKLTNFIEDLSHENPQGISHSLVRCKKEEPLTI
tara:strand:+ start:512 stop:742 length:231 start_codon:yes stop_codon:yes gene_type:complete